MVCDGFPTDENDNSWRQGLNKTKLGPYKAKVKQDNMFTRCRIGSRRPQNFWSRDHVPTYKQLVNGIRIYRVQG